MILLYLLHGPSEKALSGSLYQAEDNHSFGNSMDDDLGFTCLKSTLTSVKSFSLKKINKSDSIINNKYLCDFD